ncbi:MAG: aspartate aminotransferase family protein [Candidatus Thorarchaeota archaeon]|nr:MAG: aspartate aminotransferase family protein [Candidatus Thorarchaeota archaeon]RLI60125.1 MAG: aspartate aminotransferase family protein [Candidatus Thorarchaeota archaeon]
MLEEYRKKTPHSRELFERAQQVFPGGVNHNIRTFGTTGCGAYPPFMARGNGSHIWDVDGNEYVDWWMTHFSQILGHNHPRVMEAIRQQMEGGNHLGALNERQVEFAEHLQKAIPFMEKMRFCATGSEATMYAVRVARLFTGRRLVAKAYGGWHGGNDTVGYHVKYPFDDEPFYNGVTFDFNDVDSVQSLFEKHGKDIAAVIVEPVIGAGGAIAPEPEFLPILREETEQAGSLLIFDEIITGFRLRYGSAGKNAFGVEPDLITLGKIAAGGMPLGAYGGREDVMEYANPKTPGSRWVGGGTFSSHPLTMAAGIAVLEELSKLRNEYARLNRRGDETRSRLNTIFNDYQVPVIATGIGSIIFVTWLRKELEPPLTGYRLAAVVDHEHLDIFQTLLIESGVFGYHGLGALSFAHSTEDIEQSVAAVEGVIQGMSDKSTVS